MSTWYYISNDEGYNRTHRSFVLFFCLVSLHKASTILSLVLCPDFMVIVVGQASFLLHISYEILPILKGISVGKS